MKSTKLDRRRFFTLSTTAAGLILLPRLSIAQNPVAAQQVPQTSTQPVTRPDPLKPELVKEFVTAGHFDLDKTKKMLTETPKLLNAAWDWGGGDFEMAIGGAGHMGRKDIALYLISQGSRFDIFVAAMLGRLDAVKAILSIDPTLANSLGPHGIPLMAHAKKGGEDAVAVVNYLASL
jgi:hypothetical protein